MLIENNCGVAKLFPPTVFKIYHRSQIEWKPIENKTGAVILSDHLIKSNILCVGRILEVNMMNEKVCLIQSWSKKLQSLSLSITLKCLYLLRYHFITKKGHGGKLCIMITYDAMISSKESSDKRKIQVL